MLKGYGARIVIGVAFYMSGFLLAANILEMSGPDIAAGLVAGAVGGVTALLVTLHASFDLKPEIRRRLGWNRP